MDHSDPEQYVLMTILEKMLKKHNVTGFTEKTTYNKFQARKWESIEDKLKCLNPAEEVPELMLAYPKDFIK